VLAENLCCWFDLAAVCLVAILAARSGYVVGFQLRESDYKYLLNVPKFDLDSRALSFVFFDFDAGSCIHPEVNVVLGSRQVAGLTDW
jgi:hypothetical protein